MVSAPALTRERLEELRRQPASVPCAGCTACCRNDRVYLSREDDPRAYRWHTEDGFPVLDRKADGSCVYLGEQGCTIHDRAPAICRRMDCRVLFLLTDAGTRQQRAAQNPQLVHVYAAGESRLHTLEH